MLAELFFSSYVATLFARSLTFSLGVACVSALLVNVPLTHPGALGAIVLGSVVGMLVTYLANTPRLLDALILPEHEEAPRGLVVEAFLGAIGAASLVLLLVEPSAAISVPSVLVVVVLILATAQRTRQLAALSRMRYTALQNLKFLVLATLLAGGPVLGARVLALLVHARLLPLLVIAIVVPPVHGAFHLAARSWGDLPGRLVSMGGLTDLSVLLVVPHILALVAEFAVGATYHTDSPGTYAPRTLLSLTAGIMFVVAPLLALDRRSYQNRRLSD